MSVVAMRRDAEAPSRPIKLLHVILTFDIGGEQRYLIRLANRLDRRFEQTIVYNWGTALRDEVAPHIDVLELGGRKMSLRRPQDWPGWASFAKNLARIVRERDVDIVTTYNPGIPQLLASVVGRRAGKKVVHIIQRPFGNRAPTEDVIARTPGLRQAAYGLTDRFVALGSYYAQDQLTRFHIPVDKIHVNYIGIDISEYRPRPELGAEVRAEFGVSAETPLIGVVARHNPEKGIGRGLRMFKHLHDVLPAARLLLVGDGPTHAQHLDEIRQLGIEGAVLVAGARPDSARLMNGCDAIMQTTFNPLNGISSIEAMATGKPVLTVVEQLEEEKMAADTCVDGKNGLFLRLTEPEVTAKRLAALLQDRVRLQAMGALSRQMAEQRFEIGGHVRRMEEFYESLVAGEVGTR